MAMNATPTRLPNGWLQFNASIGTEAEVSQIVISPREIVMITNDYVNPFSDSPTRSPTSRVWLRMGGSPLHIEGAEEERLIELVGDRDPHTLSEHDLQFELELAERKHTRLLAEVHRRQG